MNELQQISAKVLDRDPGLPLIEFDNKIFTLAEVKRLADQLDALLHESGADERAPVAFIARNQPASLAALLGLLRAGRTVRMIYPFQSPNALARNVEKLKPAIVVAAPAELAEEVLDAVRSIGASAIAIREMNAEALPGFERSTTPLDPDLPRQPQIEILTSGTTGPPKHFALSYETIAKHFVSGEDPMRPSASDNAPPTLAFFPLGNISGVYSIFAPLLRGMRIQLLERFNIDAWRNYIVRYRPVWYGLPAALVPVVLDAKLPPEDLASVRYYSSGAAALDPTVQRAFEERYGGKILLSYGATEFGGPVTAMSPELHDEWGERKYGSVGRAYGGNQIRVVDADTGEPLPPGVEGILEVIAPRIGPNWIRTADIAVIDEDGFLYHRGRADGAIVRGGFKILPETIERALALHPAVGLVAVAGKKDRRLGEAPVAAIVPKPGITPPEFGELEAHLREHVLATHIPVAWRYVTEMPRTLSMKIDRRRVAQMFEEDG